MLINCSVKTIFKKVNNWLSWWSGQDHELSKYSGFGNHLIDIFWLNVINLCSFRYWQVFDELIRQETIIMAERGLLMKRVKSELDLVAQTFEELIASGGHYSLRKNILCTYNTQEAEKRLNDAQNAKDKVLNEVCQLKTQLESEERHQIEVRTSVEKTRANEINFWTRLNQILRTHIHTFKVRDS